MKKLSLSLIGGSALLALTACLPVHAAVDADAAQALFKKDE